jgi:transcriptional regulator with XRE-family HTH domain
MADDALSLTVGSRLREAREARQLSLRGLARAVDLSPGMLSQIENGHARPSVGTLWALVSELGLSLDAVFPTLDETAGPDAPAEAEVAAPSSPVVQRAGRRQVLQLSGDVSWEQLNAPDDTDVVFAHVTYRPGEATPGHADLPLARHTGREYGYVVSGRLVVEVGSDEVELGPGDAITFGSETPHRFRAAGDEPARAVWFNRAR